MLKVVIKESFKSKNIFKRMHYTLHLKGVSRQYFYPTGITIGFITMV